jgi:hypothetical protein
LITPADTGASSWIGAALPVGGLPDARWWDGSRADSSVWPRRWPTARTDSPQSQMRTADLPDSARLATLGLDAWDAPGGIDMLVSNVAPKRKAVTALAPDDAETACGSTSTTDRRPARWR